MFDQTSVYYRRHLLLHEGTHCFMHTLLGGVGPPWYAEGMAELLATHRLEGGKLALDYFPRATEEVSKWGRIEVVQRCCAEHRAMPLEKIFAYGGTLDADAEPYAWSWAAAAFFAGHPRYRERFRVVHRHTANPDFQRRFEETFADPRLNEDWQLFAANLDYGYDFERMEFEPAPGKPLGPGTVNVTVAADRGWQPGGVALEAGKRYTLRASGRYVVGHEPDGKPWTCEPGGITLEYYRGRPLGTLLAAIRADEPGAGESTGLVRPITIGLGAAIEPKRSGTLYLRINDSAGRLADNSGTATVEISRD
jgi:hypothetical protein